MAKFTLAGVTGTPAPAQEAPAAPKGPPNAGVFPVAVPIPRWQRARDRACAALLAGETRLLITGPPGTGKTALAHEIVPILRYAGWTVTVGAAGLPYDEAADPHVGVLVIDEADRLSHAELRDLAERRAGPVV